MQSYKFRLYPTYQQQNRLQNALEACRWIYNNLIESSRKNYLSRNETNCLLTEIKQEESWLYNYNAKMLQMISAQIDGAQKAIIRLRKKGTKQEI